MADALKGFDPAALFKEYETAINPITKKLYTFEEAQKLVNQKFRETTKEVEETSVGLTENEHKLTRGWKSI